MSNKLLFNKFKLKIDNDKFIEILNSKYPISLKENKDLIDRISNKYPYITKTKISLIVKECFYLIRELLFLNKKLYFAEFLPYFYLKIFKKKSKLYKEYITIDVKARIPEKVKRDE